MPIMAQRMRALLCLLLAAPLLSSSSARAQEREVNVALSQFGATARASSVYAAGYEAANALDGRWARRETDKWNSSANATPHWLVVDLGQERVIRRIVIRHEGVLGQGDEYDTRDFQVQRGASADGPWTDLVAPIRGNTANVSEHKLAPVSARYLRLYITQGEQGRNEFARIFEFEVYSRVADLREPLIVLAAPAVYRQGARGIEQKLVAQVYGPGSAVRAPASAEVGGSTVGLGAPDADGRRIGWAPVPAAAGLADATVVVAVPGAAPVTVLRRVSLAPPGQALGSASFPPFFAGGAIHLLSSSHQDIAWMDTPQRCEEQRDRQVITPALDKMRTDPGFRFGMEDALSLVEYLGRHPERRDEVLQRTREHRFEWGATFNQPYEGLESGEFLVRQVYFGRRLVRKLLPGCGARAAWNCDVPGRAAQMPQILAKSGVPYLVISRHAPGIFRWNSPDGSGVTAFSPGHYCDAWGRLQADTPTVAANTAADLSRWTKVYEAESLKPAFGYIVSVDSSGPTDFAALRSQWPTWEGTTQPASGGAPALISSTAEAFLDAATAGKPNLPTITGERPNVWLYIHGPTHHHLVSAMREASVILPAAETFSTALCLMNRSFASYPKTVLDEAWKAAIYPDHGWGGYYGEITDEVFRRKAERARNLGASVVGNAVSALAARVKANRALGVPIVVFNALSWKRTDPVVAGLTFAHGQARGVEMIDRAGTRVPCQIVERTMYADGSLETASVAFVARDVPSMGYATWYARPLKTASKDRWRVVLPVIDTAAYRIELAPGGIRAIRDKARGRELLNTGKFLGGELFTMQSVGNGAGEFSEVQKPTMEEFDKLSNHRPAWRLVEDGPVRVVAEMLHLQEAAGFRHTGVRQRLIVYRDIQRIDLETDLIGWDGTPYREFRLAFPVDAKGARITYEAPMASIEVGKGEIAGSAGERYTQPCAEVRPREVQNWIDASDAAGGVTLSSSVAVCDWVDPTPGPAAYPILQPLLLASRKSCHGLGNYYLQAGDHSYRFSLFSHGGGAENGRRMGVAANSPLIAVTQTGAPARADQPEARSFFGVSASNVVITTVKKAEDEDAIAVRCCEMDGRGAEASITSFVPVVSGRHASMIEDPGEPLQVVDGAARLAVGHHSIETVLLTPRKTVRK